MLKKVIKSFLFYFYKNFKQREREFKKRYYTDLILKSPVSRGVDISVNGEIKVVFPKGLVLGNNVHIGNGAHIDARAGLLIGSHTHISRNLTVYTTNHDYEGKRIPYDENLIPGRVLIEKGVWIGMNVSITPGVTIGEGAVLGMGSVISKNVSPGEIVVGNSQRVIGKRDELHFREKLNKNQIGGINGIVYENIHTQTRNIFSGNNIVFVLSTGRAGSNSIEKIFNKHPEISAHHETFYTFLEVLSINYLAGKTTKESVKKELGILFTNSPYNIQDCVYMESDQKLVPFIDFLIELFPRAKFMWLIREPFSFLKSAYARGWFKKDQPLFSNGTVLIQPAYPSRGCRVTGDVIGEYSKKTWDGMKTEAKILWYWQYWNELTEKGLKGVPCKQKLIITTEDINSKIQTVTEFIGIKANAEMKPVQSNIVKKRHRKAYENFVVSQNVKEQLNKAGKYYNEIRNYE